MRDTPLRGLWPWAAHSPSTANSDSPRREVGHLAAMTLFVLLAARTFTDPRYSVVLDPHQHGRHTFMVSMVSGLVGLGLAVPRRSKAVA